MLYSTKLAVLGLMASAANAQLTVSTPAGLFQCEPVSLSWSGGSGAPYYVAIIPGGQPSAPALETLPTAQSSPLTWNVDQPVGTNVSIKVTDGSGTSQYSSSLAVESGSGTSCLNAAGSASASGSGSATASGSASNSASGSASATSSAPSSSGSATKSGAATAEIKLNGGAILTVLGVVAAAFGLTL